MWSLSWPWVLVLLPLPLWAARALPKLTSPGGALWVPESIVRVFGGHGSSADIARMRGQMLVWVIWIALVFAISGPRIISPSPAMPVSGRDIMLVLDLSGSMERMDFQLDGQPISRLDAVKKIGVEFVHRREGDRVGLVIFADRAYVAASPTFDLEGIARAITNATIGIAGRNTAIGDGIGMALKRLEQSPSKSRVIILLSDGANNAGSVGPRSAANLARDLGIRVHTIALGENDLESGAEDPDAVDSATLRKVAEISGGTGFRVKTLSDLQAVTAEIDRMETNRGKAPPAEVFTDLWIYPAIIALIASLVFALLELGFTPVVILHRLRWKGQR